MPLWLRGLWLSRQNPVPLAFDLAVLHSLASPEAGRNEDRKPVSFREGKEGSDVCFLSFWKSLPRLRADMSNMRY